jgi:hypothetical protein
MPRGNVIVCEARSRWARWLRPALAATDCDLCEVRSLSEAWRELTNHSESVLALEATAANLARVGELVAGAHDEFVGAPVIVLTTPQLARYEWALRELGAQYVASSAVDVCGVVGIVDRYTKHLPVPPQRPITEAVRDRLPWREPRHRLLTRG